MFPLVLIFGGIAALAYFSRGSSSSKGAPPLSPSLPLPEDPLKKPIVVTSPPTPGVAPDVQKEVEKILSKKPKVKPSAPKAKVSPLPENIPGATAINTTLKENLEAPSVPPAPSYIPGADALNKEIAKITESDKALPLSPDASLAVKEIAKNMQESTVEERKNILNHALLPRPSSPAVKLAKVQTLPQALNYARSAFHAIVDFAEKGGPNSSKDLAAMAAMSYYKGSTAAQGNDLKLAMESIKTGNALSDRAVKERSGA